jgi:hypothetical protein
LSCSQAYFHYCNLCVTCDLETRPPLHIHECWSQLREYFKVHFYLSYILSEVVLKWQCPNNIALIILMQIFFIVASVSHRGRREDGLWSVLLKVNKMVDFSSIQERKTSWWSTYANLRIRCLGDHRY